MGLAVILELGHAEVTGVHQLHTEQVGEAPSGPRDAGRGLGAVHERLEHVYALAPRVRREQIFLAPLQPLVRGGEAKDTFVDRDG